MSRTLLLLIFLISIQTRAAELSPVKMSISGDSTVTGAATHRHLKPFFANLLLFASDVYWPEPDARLQASDYPFPQEFNIQDPVKRLRRVTYSPQEYQKVADEVDPNSSVKVILAAMAKAQKVGESKISRAFDIPEHSFAYLIGMRMGIQPSEMLMAAQDGKKVNSITVQIERIMSVTKSSLPPVVLISYGLNDICHPNDVSADVNGFKANFKTTVKNQLNAIRARPAAPGGTTVFISAPLDATNLMDNDDLMSQKIPFEGAGIFKSEVSCTELRDKSFPRQTAAGLVLRDMFIGECKGLRQNVADPKARVANVRRLQEAQIEAWREAINEIKDESPGFKWILGESIRSIKFTAGDLANDCFHPSPRAHAKIASQFLANELR